MEYFLVKQKYFVIVSILKSIPKYPLLSALYTSLSFCFCVRNKEM